MPGTWKALVTFLSFQKTGKGKRAPRSQQIPLEGKHKSSSAFSFRACVHTSPESVAAHIATIARTSAMEAVGSSRAGPRGVLPGRTLRWVHAIGRGGTAHLGGSRFGDC